MSLPSLFDRSPEELSAFFRDAGQPAYRTKQVLRWAYGGAASYQEMTDLPRELGALLQERVPLLTLVPIRQAVSSDGLTQKLLFRLRDGSLIEAVGIRRPNAKGSWRGTICVSSQAGCAYGCRFCATGQQGYGRNLSAGEIVEQVLYFLRSEEWKGRPSASAGPARQPTRPITNVVFMGMGEPFANYDAVCKAVVALNAPWGLGLAARHITVSTVGLAPEIRRFAESPLQAGLAVSLHAPNDALRSRLVPVNRKYPLRELIAACRDYTARTNRRVSFEYVLLDRVNDGARHAQELAQLLSGLLCHVNLIPINPTESSEFRRPSPARVHGFLQEIRRQGIPVTLRDTQGVDIQAGCGQLRARGDEQVK